MEIDKTVLGKASHFEAPTIRKIPSLRNLAFASTEPIPIRDGIEIIPNGIEIEGDTYEMHDVIEYLVIEPEIPDDERGETYMPENTTEIPPFARDFLEFPADEREIPELPGDLRDDPGPSSA